MVESKKILLVEGESDKSFFQKICNKLDLHTEVQVALPRDLMGTHNSKEGVFSQLELLLRQLPDGNYSHVAVVVDADYQVHNGLGFKKTIDKVSNLVKLHGFDLDPDVSCGKVFKHSDGLADFGLWIMPNNQDEGMLEDWIKACVGQSELELFKKAKGAVQAIPKEQVKFSHKISKAEIATWLAWQKQPGHGLYITLKDQLLDNEHPLFIELEAWLLKIFS